MIFDSNQWRKIEALNYHAIVKNIQAMLIRLNQFDFSFSEQYLECLFYLKLTTPTFISVYNFKIVLKPEGYWHLQVEID